MLRKPDGIQAAILGGSGELIRLNGGLCWKNVNTKFHFALLSSILFDHHCRKVRICTGSDPQGDLPPGCAEFQVVHDQTGLLGTIDI